MGAPTRPSCPRCPARVDLPPSPCQVVRPKRHAALTGTAPRRVIAPQGTTPGPSPRHRPRPPRGPLLGRGCVVLAVIARTASAASLRPSRRLPVLRLYAGSLPSGRVLAGTQTFPALNIDPCLGATAHTPGSPAGARVRFLPRRRWPSPMRQRLGAPGSPQLALSAPPQRELLVDGLTTLQRSRDAAAPRLARPLSQPTSTKTVGPSGTCTSGSTPRSRPPDAPDMTTWVHRTTPRTGLSPAGSMLLRAVRRRMRETRRSWQQGISALSAAFRESSRASSLRLAHDAPLRAIAPISPNPITERGVST